MTAISESEVHLRAPPRGVQHQCWRARSPPYLSASIRQTLSIRRRQVCHRGVLTNLQRLSFKALKPVWAVVVVVGSEEYTTFCQGGLHLSLGTVTFPLGFKIYWSSLVKSRGGTCEQLRDEAICRMNWTGCYGFYNLLPFFRQTFLKLCVLHMSHIKFKRAKTEETSGSQADDKKQNPFSNELYSNFSAETNAKWFLKTCAGQY